MRFWLYSLLVNRHPGICIRYHRFHDGTVGFKKFISWVYLIWLNIAYYVFFCRFLGKRPEDARYEAKNLPVKDSESRLDRKKHKDLTAEYYINAAQEYDYVSFDIFDTLIFRPFDDPKDVFYLVGEKTGLMDFKNIRCWAESDARNRCHNTHKHTEVTLAQIWENLEEDTGFDAKTGMKLEMEAEESVCFANPFMLKIWNGLKAKGKKLIVISDMYLSAEFLRKLLVKNGFTGFEDIFVSCEYKKNKANGKLYREVLKKYPADIIHIGDNPHSDVKMAKTAGFDSLYYPNINRDDPLYRAWDMSPIVGSAYRGLVNAGIYCGSEVFSKSYEYGFIYGGLFVTGYCAFIHEYCKTHNVDRLLFLSRDGETLKMAYDMMFPEDDTRYVLWSRKAAGKLMARYDKHDYFRRFIYHKVNQDYTIADALSGMELDFLVDELPNWSKIQKKYLKSHGFWDNAEKNIILNREIAPVKPEDELTEKNGYLLRRFVEAYWDKVENIYAVQDRSASAYYRKELRGCKSAVVVDIGWAGSGAMALAYLSKNAWNIDAELTGIVAGTNSFHNAEPHMSESFLQSGKLVSYMYSQRHNRELYKKHDPNRDHNIYWELLLSSPNPPFKGFYEEGPKFGKPDMDADGAGEIRKGIMDFVKLYKHCFRDYGYMFDISGRDAYAPMLLAMSHNERYLKSVSEKYKLDVNVE